METITVKLYISDLPRFYRAFFLSSHSNVMCLSVSYDVGGGAHVVLSCSTIELFYLGFSYALH